MNRHLIPAFYRYLQAQEQDKQIEGAKDFLEAIEKLVEMFQKAEKDTPEAVGLWRDDGKLGESRIRTISLIPDQRQIYLTSPLFRVDRCDGRPLALPNDKRLDPLSRLLCTVWGEDIRLPG